MDKWIYENNNDNTERYVLGEKGQNMLACIGINPSTAEPNNLDNTLKNVKNIAKSNSFNGWVMFNIYPQRATNPKDMDKNLNKQSVEKNIQEIVRTVQEYNIKTIWLAYGNNILRRNYLFECLDEIYRKVSDLGVEWKIINNLTKEGHPRHPLRQRKDSIFVDFDMDEYIKLMKSRDK